MFLCSYLRSHKTSRVHQLEDGNVKDDVKMANKSRDMFIYGRFTPLIWHFHVFFDVLVLKLNLPIA